MHEMSIAMNIIDIAIEQAKKEKADRIVEVELEIGTLAGIEFESLNFAMEISVKNTMLEKSAIHINKIQAIAECIDCGKRFKTENLFNNCQKCKSYNTKLIKGKELKVKSIVID
ncbi:MAG: hydrogenase maturation nickel metallochaperone HypA [Chlorobi bacterium]|nr:hydrogenase maturation nickel metallochaperone HypA [Chlorobiota bacterium]